MMSYKDINESEDEFDWVENPIKYIKVGRRFNVKTSAEPITVQIVRIVEKPNFNRNTIYFSPINLVGTKYPGVPMNVQRLLTHINNGNWTPIKNINESEDDFGWAQETIKTSFLEFNGKEIMIDIQGLDTEELKRLYDIVEPYISKGNDFINHEGVEIVWMGNDKCFKNITTAAPAGWVKGGTGKFKSISLHCGLEDNDYLPLKGAVCCLGGTYDDEPSYSKEYIIPINAREIIGGTINESEWFEDVVKDPIMLKVEELEMGDIVIPTRFNQQEYVVTGKGTSVKMLHAPTHWVTLKRNTKENTGGVYIEHDSEIGKACRFELIHREENLNESEKPLLTEGRYDAITRKVVRDIMKLVTTSSFGDHDLPYDINNEEYEYQQENLGFSVELQIVKTEKVEDFFIDAATSDNDDDETVMLVKVFLNPTFDKQNLEKLFYKLQEVIRHEVEHFTQHGPYRIEDRPMYKGDTTNLKTVYGHHKNVIEVPALVHGFYRRAKLEKKPLDEIMIEDLDSEIEKGLLTKNQAENLLTMWLTYAKKNLPSAIYKNN